MYGVAPWSCPCELGVSLSVALTALAFARIPALALAGTAQLGDCQSFVELEDRVEHLATACLMRL